MDRAGDGLLDVRRVAGPRAGIDRMQTERELIRGEDTALRIPLGSFLDLPRQLLRDEPPDRRLAGKGLQRPGQTVLQCLLQWARAVFHRARIIHGRLSGPY